MTAETTDIEERAPKKSGKGLLIGIILAVLLGGGAFYAVWSGLILGEDAAHGGEMEPVVQGALPDVLFVPIQPLVINLGGSGENRHLRFQAQLEVNKTALDDVTRMLPRVVDVLNGYLRAVDISELENPAALVRLRAQMLRRIQVVTGEGRVRDLLIMEFVLN